jgi:hypothetical protein
MTVILNTIIVTYNTTIAGRESAKVAEQEVRLHLHLHYAHSTLTPYLHYACTILTLYNTDSPHTYTGAGGTRAGQEEGAGGPEERVDDGGASQQGNTHTHIHIHIHTHTQTHKCTHTCTHTCTQK